MKYLNRTKDVYEVTDEKTFVLWQEVIMAYVAPAIMAGIGGFITADKGLQLGALTTIGGTSVVVAWIIGFWLERQGNNNRWISGANHFIVVAIFSLIGAMLGVFTAWITSCVLRVLWPFDHLVWFDRIWIDFPLSATITCAIITWRWRLSIKKISSPKGEVRR
ncbi:hypothetical protein ACFDTO_31175 [Microbacteriaceae bacterium 4G12]